MIYLDSSVAVAHLRSEDRRPADKFWNQPLISSRLLEYEVRTVMNAHPPLTRADDEVVRSLIGRIALVELIPEIVARVRDPLPMRVRTLDALHLASITFLAQEGVNVELATYDQRMRAAAKKLKIPLYRW